MGDRIKNAGLKKPAFWHHFCVGRVAIYRNVLFCNAKSASLAVSSQPHDPLEHTQSIVCVDSAVFVEIRLTKLTWCTLCGRQLCSTENIAVEDDDIEDIQTAAAVCITQRINGIREHGLSLIGQHRHLVTFVQGIQIHISQVCTYFRMIGSQIPYLR